MKAVLFVAPVLLVVPVLGISTISTGAPSNLRGLRVRSTNSIQCGLATSDNWAADNAALGIPGLVNNHWTEDQGELSTCMIKDLTQAVTKVWLDNCKVLQLYNEPSINNIDAISAATHWKQIVATLGPISPNIVVYSPAVTGSTQDQQNWLHSFFDTCGSVCTAGSGDGHVDKIAVHAYMCSQGGKPCGGAGTSWNAQVSASSQYVHEGSCQLSNAFDGRPVQVTEFAGFLGFSTDSTSAAPYKLAPLHAETMRAILTPAVQTCIEAAYFFSASLQSQSFLAPESRAYDNALQANGVLTPLGTTFKQLCT
jgi:hypothetical protein